MKKLRIFISVPVVIAAVFFLSSLFVNCNGKKADKAEDIPVFAVGTENVPTREIEDYLGLTGDIISASTVDVFADVTGTGKIIAVNVSIGDRVTRGQAIASVDMSRPGANYVANIVRAPISGIVTTKLVDVGSTVGPQNPIVQLAGGGALEIQLHVSEKSISRIAMGLPCNITLDAYPGEIFKGRVSEISPIVDAASRTMKIKVSVDNSNDKLKAGMFASVKIIVEKKEGVIVIPENALLQHSDEYFVYTLETDTRDPAFRVAKRTLVQTGIIVDGIAEVKEGLKAGEEIVVRGQTNLSNGSRVNIINN